MSLHGTYQDGILHLVKKKFKKRHLKGVLQGHTWLVVQLFLLNLGRVQDKLEGLYDEQPRGQSPADPVCLFRSLVMMVLFKVSSITKWVAMLEHSAKTDGILANLTGFPLIGQPLPGVGTYYRFFDRLIDGGPPSLFPPGQAPSQRRKQDTLRPPRHIRKEQHKEFQQELDKKGASQSQQLFEKIRDNQIDALPNDLVKRVNELLFLCVVQPSKEMGLFGGLNPLHLSGDGSTVLTGANPRGKPSCDCHLLGIKQCDHDRYYSDPKAEIGYDSYRKRFYFGHILYIISFHGEGFDLPVFVNINSALETDYTHSIRSIEAMLALWNGYQVPWEIRSFTGDGHHDSYGVYNYLKMRNILPVIPLNENSKRALVRMNDGRTFSENGVPLCPAGVEMELQGRNLQRHELVYVCPCKSKNAGALDKCPLAPLENPNYLCQPETKWGPTKKIHTDDDPRLFPLIARNTKEYKELYNARTANERVNSTTKDVYELEKARHRHQEFWLIRTMFIHICHHLNVWFRRDEQNREMSVEQFIDKMEKPAEQAASTS